MNNDPNDVVEFKMYKELYDKHQCLQETLLELSKQHSTLLTTNEQLTKRIKELVAKLSYAKADAENHTIENYHDTDY